MCLRGGPLQVPPLHSVYLYRASVLVPPVMFTLVQLNLTEPLSYPQLYSNLLNFNLTVQNPRPRTSSELFNLDFTVRDSSPSSSSYTFKVAHCEARTVSEGTVGIRLKCLLVIFEFSPGVIVIYACRLITRFF